MFEKLKNWASTIESKKLTFKFGSYYSIKVGENYLIIRLLYIERNKYFHYYEMANVDTLENLDQMIENCIPTYRCEDLTIFKDWNDIQFIKHVGLSENDYNQIIQKEEKKDFREKMQFFSERFRDYQLTIDSVPGKNVIYRFRPEMVSIYNSYHPKFFTYFAFSVYAMSVVFFTTISKVEFPSIFSKYDSSIIFAILWLIYGIVFIAVQIKYKMTFAVVRGFTTIFKVDNKFAFYFILLLNVVVLLILGFFILLVASIKSVGY